jgi:hypothetical protein
MSSSVMSQTVTRKQTISKGVCGGIETESAREGGSGGVSAKEGEGKMEDPPSAHGG